MAARKGGAGHVLCEVCILVVQGSVYARLCRIQYTIKIHTGDPYWMVKMPIERGGLSQSGENLPIGGVGRCFSKGFEKV